MMKGVDVKVEGEEGKWIRYDVMGWVDRGLMNGEMMKKIEVRVVREVEWEVLEVEGKYVD